MINIIENQGYRIKVSTKGAELVSFFDKKSNEEVIWQGDEAYWKRSSPTLFPFIGAVKNNAYCYKGKKYPMTRHGFVRDANFKLVDERKNFLSYQYTSNEETKKMFPFDFELLINYLLVDNSLTMEYVLKNLSNEMMYYNLGGHTAYNFDMRNNDVSIIFEKLEKKRSGTFDLKSGLRLNKEIELLNNQRELMMSFELFEYDTLLLKDLVSNYLILDSKKQEKPRVKITFGDFPYLALWTPKAPFLCVEPWHGVTDDLDSEGHIEEKRGIQILNAGVTKILTTKIEII